MSSVSSARSTPLTTPLESPISKSPSTSRSSTPIRNSLNNERTSSTATRAHTARSSSGSENNIHQRAMSVFSAQTEPGSHTPRQTPMEVIVMDGTPRSVEVTEIDAGNATPRGQIFDIFNQTESGLDVEYFSRQLHEQRAAAWERAIQERNASIPDQFLDALSLPPPFDIQGNYINRNDISNLDISVSNNGDDSFFNPYLNLSRGSPVSGLPSPVPSQNLPSGMGTPSSSLND